MTETKPFVDTLRGVLHAFFRHKGKAIAFFVIVVVGVALLTFLMPEEFRSEGKLFVRLGRENATLDPTVTLGPNPIVAVPLSRESEINSVVEILQSRALLEKVVDALGPQTVLNSSKQEAAPNGAGQEAGSWIGQTFSAGKHLLRQLSSTAGLDERERAVIEISKHIKVEAAKKSNVIDITYQGPTPKLSQSVVAALIDTYLDEHVRLNRTHGSHKFLADQTQRLQKELTRRELELRDLKDKTGLASPDVQRKLLVARIGRIEDELLHTQTARAVAKAKVGELRRKLTSLPNTQVARETSGFSNEGTDRMREQFYALQVREKEAQAKYTDNHPKMRQIHEQIAASHVILEQEEETRRQITKEPGRLHHQAQSALLSELPLLASLDAQTARLQSQLTTVRGELVELNKNEMRFSAIQREVDLLEADYRKYAANLEQTRIDQQREIQQMSNISVAQAASFEPRPVRPRKLLNLLLGVCVGAFGGLALPLVLEQFDDSLQTSDDIEGHLDLPTLATIPRLKPKQLVVNGRK